jgi:hypothetical protein
MKFMAIIMAAASCLIIVTGCGNSTKDFTERKLVIANKQTVKVKELGLSITNYGCARQWESADGKTGTEKPYCELEIQYKDSIINAGSDFKPIYIGDAVIQMDKINPWGKEEDSIPPGGCRLWVKKVIRR